MFDQPELEYNIIIVEHLYINEVVTQTIQIDLKQFSVYSESFTVTCSIGKQEGEI